MTTKVTISIESGSIDKCLEVTPFIKSLVVGKNWKPVNDAKQIILPGGSIETYIHAFLKLNIKEKPLKVKAL